MLLCNTTTIIIFDLTGETVIFLAIADSTNKFEKLMMVIGEMRGEASLAFKGDMQAKQRFEASKKHYLNCFLQVQKGSSLIDSTTILLTR